jgi:peptidoglycan/LPS O-acetylase OafA/YrhL
MGFAVDIFFILSGFVMSHAYGSKIQNNKINLGSFALLRLGRLYPLIVVGSIAAILTYWLLNDRFLTVKNLSIADSIFMHMFFFQISRSIGDGFMAVFWSIGIEFWVGLTLFYGVIRYKAYFVNFLIVVALMFYFYGGKNSLFFGIDIGLINGDIRRGLLGIGLGIVVYQIYYSYKNIKLSKITTLFIKSVFYMLFVVLIIWMIASQDMKKTLYINHAFLAILASAMILLGALLKNECKPFCAKWQSWLGDISYSVYIYHTVVIWFALPWIRSLNLSVLGSLILGAVFVLTITFIVSHYSHKYIEKPAYRWFRKKIGQ